jgi:PAS domain S-box-containing protein
MSPPSFGNETGLTLQSAALEAAASGILITDAEGTILWLNPAFSALTGFSSAELVGRNPRVLKSDRHDAAFYQEFWRTLRTGRTWRGEFINRRKDGRLYIVEQTVTPIQVDGGGITHFIAVAQDVTERKAVEEQLRLVREQLEFRVQEREVDLDTANRALVESQERFRQMAENIRDVFWLASPTRLSLSYVSPAYAEIWGRPCEELYSNPAAWFEAIHPADRPRIREWLRQPVPADGYECSYRIVRPDGSVRWVSDRAFPVRDSVGNVYRLAGIARDITERRELEQEVLAISEREQRRIGQDLHDDLCQELVGIEYLSQALQQRLKEQPQGTQAGEIARLIRAAIDHTRFLARGLAPIELSADGLMRGLGALAARTSEVFRLQCSFHCPVPVLITDVTVATALYRIAQEAVSNAAKHAKPKNIEIHLTASSDKAVLTVKDDGLGFSTAGRGPRGMGLRIMQYRAAMLGGTFTIEKQPTRGTDVVCTVPFGAPGHTASASE